MKVLLLNGSPRKNGCTYTALMVVADALKAEGIETEVFQAGDPDMENVKAAAAKLKESDALVVGSPVYWASPSGQIIEFMDRLASVAGKDMLYKPGSCRSFRQKGRNYFYFRCAYQIFFLSPDAGRIFLLLEHGTRKCTRRSNERRRRSPDHACPWKEHGMAVKMHRSRKESWCGCSSGRG